MDGNIFSSAAAGIAQGLERGIQSQYNIQQQGMNQRLQIQKMAEEQQYRQQAMSMQQDEASRRQQEFEMKLQVFQDAKTKEKAFNILNAYLDDGNERHFNNGLTEDPELRKLYGGLVRIDKFNPSSDADKRLFAEAGGLGDLADPKVQKRYVKAILPDGTAMLQDVFAEAKRNGTWKTWNDERWKSLESEAKVAEMNAKAIKYASGGDDDTAMQKNYQFLKGKDAKLGEDYLKKETGWAPTSQTKEGLELEKVKKELPSNFFEKTYVPGTPEYRELEPKVQKIEKLAGIKLDSATRKEISNIKQIITLADPASKLTEADTGLIDNTFGNLSKYVSDKAPAPSKAAYNQIMTSIRNATYGATLPAAEMSAFAEAYGTLYQQTPAIRDSLKTSLTAVKSKLEAYAYVGDEAVSHFRFGADEKKLNGIIDNLQNLLDATEAKQPGKKSIKPNIPLPSKSAAENTSNDYMTPPPATVTKEYTDGIRAKNQAGQVLIYRTGKGWVAE